MSAPGASPSGFSNGATPTGATPNGTTPNGTAPKFRRPVKSDPLRPRNKKPVRKTLAELGLAERGAKTAQPALGKNAALGSMGRGVAPPPPQPVQPMANGGWTNPPPNVPYQDLPLVTTVRQLKESMKYHVLRFSSKKEVNPADPNEFTRPISLHRRNPQQQPSGKFKDEDTPMGDGDDKDREKYEILKQEREDKRAAELAQIAPSLSTATKKNISYKLGKTTQVRHMNMNEQDQKEANNRYEEALPWHLEDAENAQTWMGIYEAALSDTHVALVPKNNKYYMLPIEKWYKFMSKNHFKTMTTEEAEAAMNKKVKEPRWVMEQDVAFKEAREKLGAKHFGLYRVKGESTSFKNSNRGEHNDMDDLDYEEMDFADDEEHVTVEKDQDEDTKDAEERVKRDQLKANLFGEADVLAADKEAEVEELEAEEKKVLGRELTKALVKREKNYIYNSDGEEFSSDDDDDEKLKLKEEARKKEEEAAKLKVKSESKAASGASTKGTSTPLGRPPKHPELKKGTLKRAGSPNLSASEASGTESARKKIKSKPSSSQPIPQRNPSVIKLNVNSDKMNKITSGAPRPAHDADGDAEMSDGPKKIKLRIGSNTNGASPSSSRAGSPLLNTRAGGSRAGSPQVANKAPKQASDKPLDFTAADVYAALPVEGTTIPQLLQQFKVQAYSKNAQREFIDLVKMVAVIDKTDKKLKANPAFKAPS